jgi:hypothetical protein
MLTPSPSQYGPVDANLFRARRTFDIRFPQGERKYIPVTTGLPGVGDYNLDESARQASFFRETTDASTRSTRWNKGVSFTKQSRELSDSRSQERSNNPGVGTYEVSSKALQRSFMFSFPKKKRDALEQSFTQQNVA